MTFQAVIERSPLVLAEAAVIERLAQEPRISLDAQLFNAPLIYSPEGRRGFYTLYRAYIGVALQAGLPMMLLTPTWRAGRDQILAARLERPLHQDATRFMRNLIRDLAPEPHPVILGGLMGSQRDCYRPDLAPGEDVAERYHAWQVAQLAETDVDFLLAATLPSVAEAKGVARALQVCEKPYLISFVINSQGCVLDGTKLAEAIGAVDRAARRRPPLGYMVNCAYPSFLDMAALPQEARERLVGYQANASSKPHAALDGSATRHMDDLDDWAERMAALHLNWGLKILGGCCGTGHDHLQRMVAGILAGARSE